MDPMNEVHVSTGANLLSIAKGRSEEGDKAEQNFWFLQASVSTVILLRFLHSEAKP